MSPRFPRLRRWLAALLLLALAAYLAALGWMWARQEQLLFFPVPLAADAPLAPAPDVHESMLAVPGARLSVLHLRLPKPKGVVLFLHGNAGNLARWFGDAKTYREANLDLVMVDYRGYGKSTGRIESEAQLRADVRAVWDHISPAYAGQPRVLLGQSLGSALASGLAAELARERQPNGHAPAQPSLLVLVSPFRSIEALARDRYPWVPSALLRYPLRNDAALAGLTLPLLMVHGTDDAVVPASHSEALLALVPQAQLLRIPGAGHSDLYRHPVYPQALARAFASLR